MINFEKAVQKEFDAVITAYNLMVKVIDKNEILLFNKNMEYAFHIFFSTREGVEIKYLKIEKKLVFEYNIEHYLLTKRSSRPNPESEKCYSIQNELKAIVYMLTQYGQDILSGNTDWLKDYYLSPRKLRDFEVTNILDIHEQPGRWAK